MALFNEDFYRADHSVVPEQVAADPLDILLLLEAEEAGTEDSELERIRDNNQSIG